MTSQIEARAFYVSPQHFSPKEEKNKNEDLSDWHWTMPTASTTAELSCHGGVTI
jgi:hypothetical protein